METYYPNQYPTPWAIDPQIQAILAGRPEKIYAILIKSENNTLIDAKRLSEELQVFHCFLIVYAYSEYSVLSDISQSLIACHFAILDTSIPTGVFAWILGAYAGLNRPVFLLNKNGFLPELKCGAFKLSLCLMYDTFENLLKQWLLLLPTFFKNLNGLNNFEKSLERFLETCLKKLDIDQIHILKFLLLLDRNPYTEEELISPLRKYSERYLDIFLSDWSEYIVSLGLLRKQQIQMPYGELVPHYHFSEKHIPILRKLLFLHRHSDPIHDF